MPATNTPHSITEVLEIKQKFLSAAGEWTCDDYALDIRYIAKPTVKGPIILSVEIGVYPIEFQVDNSFFIHTEDIWVGQVQRYPVKKMEIEQILLDASNGKVALAELTLRLEGSSFFDYYSEMTQRDRWFSPLHLELTGGLCPRPSPQTLLKIDNDLRSATPPFDGLADLVGWLGIGAVAFDDGLATIAMHVGPPADLIFDRCKLSNDQLTIELHAHPSFETKRLSLAIRSVPGHGLSGRMQLTSLIEWGDVFDGKKIGIIRANIPNSDSVLTMLMIGGSTLRRQWLVDADKARNNRWMAVQHFDADLRVVRDAVLNPIDSRRFEQGISSLLFLLGFSPAVQIENDAPDLIVATPGGQLVLVECTVKIADFSSKLGKLVDRRGSLSKSFISAGHSSEMLAVLVCAVERDQIAVHKGELDGHKILLLTKEDIISGFERVRHHVDPDKFVGEALVKLDSTQRGALINATT